MSDMSQGIDLDFGGVDAIVGYDPVPDGIYILRIDDAHVVPTKDQRNSMVKVTMIVDVPADSPLAKFNGRNTFDQWMLPNPAAQTPDAMLATKGYLKGKLEAVTGGPLPDRYRLVPRELAGCKFKALVAKVDEGFGPQNKIRRYMPLSHEDTPQLTAPAVSRPQQNQNAQQGGEPAAAGRFRI